MDEPVVLPPAEIRALRQTAERVVAALTGAGLAAWVKDLTVSAPPATGGAEVWIETLAGTTSGVYVGWLQPPDVETTVRDAVARLDLTHSELPHAGRVLELMRQVIQAVLEHAGFPVRDASRINGAQAFIPH
ncbi:hypothetical protein ACQPZJ_41660 [Actinoplanes sp. CA-054009]